MTKWRNCKSKPDSAVNYILTRFLPRLLNFSYGPRTDLAAQNPEQKGSGFRSKGKLPFTW